jgi:hypothetical protein
MLHRSSRPGLAWLIGLLLVVGSLAIPATAVADHIPPPRNLHVSAVYEDGVYLMWEPGSDDSSLRYRVHNLTLGWTLDTSATSLRWSIGLQSGRTYDFAVTHVDPDDHQSAPSNQVAATPLATPPTNVEATLDGDLVTIAWRRPDGIDPVGVPGKVFYYVYLDGVPETHIRASRAIESLSVSIPRVRPGTTHQYTVGYGTLVGDPAFLPIPPAQDTISPTRPAWHITCPDDFSHGWEITEESTDDTTAQTGIRYEYLENRPPFGYSVINYNLARSGDHLENFSSGDSLVRSVDEAGNRSALATPVWEC